MRKTLAVLLFIPAAAAAAVPSACGGITEEERRSLPTLVPDANLELLFVEGKRGAYTAGAQWRVLDRSNEPVAYGTAEGPICLLRVPAGPLHVEARLGDETRTAKANATASGKRTRLVFTFTPKSEEDVEATPEEKQEGRR